MNKKRSCALLAAVLMIALTFSCALTALADGSTYTYHGTYAGVST